ncbi:hypothetical protein HELRODRAFT_185555 [Helobdella robusta]|uniref:SAP domain-containing protein n=1 Tax=Helobdella robusta TaxID=6412 RepID=T1FMZ2_HELRO|nr:hypothetical protein HELRODRAFT_185555 [Helobdella robusta]ESO05127.1 hypothetical protein HELRODRAFT_185555 [Helobdella robusta]
MHSESELQKLKVADLKKLCKEKGLNLLGTKSELVSRLLEFQNAEEKSSTQVTPESNTPQVGQVATTGMKNGTKEVHGVAAAADIAADIAAADSKSTSKADTTTPTQPAVSSDSQEPSKPKINKIEAPISGDVQAKNKLEQRIKRFGVVSEDTKKLVRAARFKSADASDSTTGTGDQNVLKKRAERFNIKSKASAAADPEVILKRKQRFGDVTIASTSATTTTITSKADDNVILKRKAKFGDVKNPSTSSAAVVGGGDVDTKRQKRAERFGLKK